MEPTDKLQILARGSTSTDTTLPSRLPSALSEEERRWLQMVEESRYEIRRDLEQRNRPSRSQYWLDKFVAPLGIVLVTAITTGLLVPFLGNTLDRSRRQRDLTTKVVDEIATATARLDTTTQQYSSAIDEYWRGVAQINWFLGDLSVKRDVGEVSEDSFQKENSNVEHDRTRVQNTVDEARFAFDKEHHTFAVWLRSLDARASSWYGDDPRNKLLRRQLQKMREVGTQMKAVLTARDTEYNSALNKQINAVRDLRKRLRAKELTPQEYRKQVDPILAAIRHFEPLPAVDLPRSDVVASDTISLLARMKPAL